MKQKKVLTEVQVEKRKAVLDTLKSMIFPLVLCAILAIGVFLIINFVNPVEESNVVQPYAYSGEGEEIVIENDYLILTMDSLTTDFTITQKSTGKVWASVAKDGGNDPVALASEKGKLQSNLVLSYAIQTGLETVYDSYTYSISNGIYEIEVEGDTIKLFYSLGNVEKEYIIPPVITAEEFEYWKGLMDLKESNLVSEYYKKYDINNLGKKDNKEELLASYPILETEVIYVCRSNTKENVKKTMQKYFEAVGYTYEDYLEDKALDMSESVSDKPIFNVEMDLTLSGNDLIVEIPFSSLESRNDNYIYTITPLPYFGAAGTDDEGYMFVPEGGGAIINYNNGKVSQSNYYANVYGWDMDLTRKSVVHNTRAYFGVFGQAAEGSSYICLMEDGASYASIVSDISGKTSSYNYVNAIYSIKSREKYDINDISNSDIYVYVDELPDESIVQRYRFLDSDSYVDMALAYKDYLQDEYGTYMTLNGNKETPIAVEIVGAVDKVKQIVGVPVSRPLELTTYKEAQAIIEELYNLGMTNMSVKLTGWCNGGVNQKILKSTKLVSALGSTKDFKNLTASANSLGIHLYLNGITQYEHDSNIFNGFFSYSDAARLLTKERAELYQYSHVTYAQREKADSYYLLHTELAIQMAENLVAQCQKYGADVSFDDIGKDLSSDFYRKNSYSREAVKGLQIDLLKQLDDSGTYLMINGGNDYAIPYSDMVVNMDLKGSNYTILDAQVPFYQIAIHGYIDYTGDSINVCGNDEEAVLNAAEYGAGLSFTIMDESSFTLQNTLYTEYYGSEYDSWKNRMLDIYNSYNSQMSGVFDQEITNHEIIDAYVRCTTYTDGTKVYVNYSFIDSYTTPEGVEVEARSYKVVK